MSDERPRIGLIAHRSSLIAVVLACLGCADGELPSGVVVTFPGSAVGREAEVLELQLARFMEAHPRIRVVQQRTPDAADQRHQLYVQWLNAGADDPDVLQLDVVWTSEFAGAGWIAALDSFAPPTADFFPAAIEANRWNGKLYALPWFVDVGMLYWRNDLLDGPPRTMDELARLAEQAAKTDAGPRHGLVWQAARYEGLVTVFVEYLAAHGASILDGDGEVVVDSEQAVAALTAMRDAVRSGAVPRAALTWQEEQTRYAFQNGHALFMRNWPYAYPLLQDQSASKVAGRFGVTALPPGRGGFAAACLGGSQLAVNANSDHPDAAYAVIEFLTRPEQMRERARLTGQYPPRRSLYEDGSLAGVLPVDVGQVKRIVESAVARPATPVYTELSEILQIRVHETLVGETEPRQALAEAAKKIRSLLRTVGLEGVGRGVRGEVREETDGER